MRLPFTDIFIVVVTITPSFRCDTPLYVPESSYRKLDIFKQVNEILTRFMNDDI
ncbi:hypothetical protein [Vaccinia virus]|uniref:Uncharacterized protein n=1 Tax=Vaccinia virus TaxID=10245 RepID=A0A2I6J113_VACCV|nr:hypothetical protein [Vaccinia virus]